MTTWPSRTAWKLLGVVALAALLGESAPGGERADSVTTRSGETIEGRRLVLSAGSLLIETAAGPARSIPARDVTAFTLAGKRTLTTTGGDVIGVSAAALAEGEVSFASGLGGLKLPFGRVASIGFAGWKEYYAKLTGGFIDAAGRVVEQQRFKGSFALGYAATSGTSDSSNLSLSLDGSMVTGPWQLAIAAKALVAQTEDEKTSDLKEASAKLDRYVNPRTYGYLRAAAFRDTITGVRLRLNAGAGLGRKLLMLDEHDLAGEAGVEYQYERTGAPGGNAELDEAAVWRAALNYGWRFSPRASFTQQLELLGQLEGASNIRSRAVSALSAKVAGNMLMKFGFSWEYDDAPPDANEHSEFRFESALVISF